MSHVTRGVALVTGGASGIGEATVHHLRAAGLRVAVHLNAGVTCDIAGLTRVDDATCRRLVRGAAANLHARGFTLTAVCPGIVDTPLIAASRQMLVDAEFPLLDADDIAATVLRAMATGRPGDCFAVPPGRAAEPYRFAGIPGPTVAAREGALPPF